MIKSKIFFCVGSFALLWGCSLIHYGLAIAVLGLALLFLSYIEFDDDEEQED